MKRNIALLLAALLLLAGCSNSPDPSGSQGETVSGTEGSEVQAPADPLEVYPLSDCTGFIPMGENYLLFGKERITVLSSDLNSELQADIPGLPDYDSGLIWVRDSGVAYYDASGCDLVFLGTNLSETSRLHMPEEITGSAVLDPGWTTAYYCTSGSVRSLDLATGVSRVLKGQAPDAQSVEACLLGGRLLVCRIAVTGSGERYLLISAQTGETVAESDDLKGLTAGTDRYFVSRMNGTVREYIFGTYGEDPQNFWPVQESEEWLYLPQANALLGLNPSENGIQADLYDLTSGTRSASVLLEGASDIRFARADGEILWLLSGSSLYRWEPAQTPTHDETVYTAPHYTEDAPDTEGLSALEAQISALESTYGVDILYWEDAAAAASEGYTFTAEYLTQAYAPALAQLETAMAAFPADFFQKAAQWTDSDTLHIALVRSILGSSTDTPTTANSLFYSLDGKAYIALAVTGEIGRQFYHEMSHAMESRILSKTTAFYEWNTLNPDGFSYSESYIPDDSRQAFCEGAGRSFIDLSSTTFPTEDRARIFEYACMEGNEDYFESKVIQQKLSRICSGIRKAYDLPEGTYLWEQYLQ